MKVGWRCKNSNGISVSQGIIGQHLINMYAIHSMICCRTAGNSSQRKTLRNSRYAHCLDLRFRWKPETYSKYFIILFVQIIVSSIRRKERDMFSCPRGYRTYILSNRIMQSKSYHAECRILEFLVCKRKIFNLICTYIKWMYEKWNMINSSMCFISILNINICF